MKTIGNQIIVLFFAIVLGFVLYSCKKYPDGGTIYNAEGKITTTGDRVWKLESFTVDGFDSTNIVRYSYSGKDVKDAFFLVEKADKSHKGMFYCNEQGSGSEFYFSFREHYSQIHIRPGVGDKKSVFFIPSYPYDHIWTIKKLTKRNLVLENNDFHNRIIRFNR